MNMEILVVDDEVAVANFLAEAIRGQGHTVTVTHRGEEAIELLAQRRPDAVFLDVLMPEMSGVEVLRRIRAVDPTLPVILITGHAREDELEEARRLGVSEVIEKPFILTHLGAALGALGGTLGSGNER
jgi:two-component system OmpR family response regulator